MSLIQSRLIRLLPTRHSLYPVYYNQAYKNKETIIKIIPQKEGNDSLFLHIAKEMQRQSKVSCEGQDFWIHKNLFSEKHSTTQVLSYILETITSPVTLVVSLFLIPDPDLIVAIRGWSERIVEGGHWGKLKIISIEPFPDELPKTNPPYNVGEIIR